MAVRPAWRAGPHHSVSSRSAGPPSSSQFDDSAPSPVPSSSGRSHDRHNLLPLTARGGLRLLTQTNPTPAGSAPGPFELAWRGAAAVAISPGPTGRAKVFCGTPGADQPGEVGRRRCRATRWHPFPREQREAMRKKLWGCAVAAALAALGGGLAVDYACDHPDSWPGRWLFTARATAVSRVTTLEAAARPAEVVRRGMQVLLGPGTSAACEGAG